MRTLIRQKRRSGREVTEWLTVIDEFDQLVADRAPLERLVDAAVSLTDRRTSVLDALNGRLCVGSPAGPAVIGEPPGEDAAVVAALTATRLRGRETGIVGVDEREVVAASVDDAGGRIGLCWLDGGGIAWRSIDELVAQRLSSAAAINSVRLRDERATHSRLDYAALEQLLSTPLSAEAAAEAVRRSGLRPGRPLVALAARPKPGGNVGPEALAQTLARTLEGAGLSARSTVIGRSAAIVVEAGAAIDEVLGRAAETMARLGVQIEIGAGTAGEPSGLQASWRQAAQALLLGPVMAAKSPVTHFDDLGVLHLLAEIPTDDLASYRDVVRVAELEATGSPVSDLDLLERYLATMSLRQTAQQVHLHHTTVQYRLKRIEQVLGIDLQDPAARLRTQIAILLYRIERAAAATGA
ncbi:MAG: helix-turn-helix domain-containing protein [Chloroflexota bacterium]